MSTTTTEQLTSAEMWDRLAETFPEDWDRRRAAIILGVSERPVYAIVRHVSTSGMFRLIDLYAEMGGEMTLLRPGWITSHKLDSRRDGYRVSGCGMDMTFHLIDTMYHETLRKMGVSREQWPYQAHLPRLRIL